MIRRNRMFTEQHDELLRKEAKKKGVSMSEVLRKALDQYFRGKTND